MNHRSLFSLVVSVWMATIVLFILSCGKDPVADRYLSDAQSFMDSAPNSAWLLLEEADSIATFSRSQRAEWNLLYTQARDKAKSILPGDSLIREAASYYTGKKDYPHSMLSYYYMARITRERGDAPQAQEYYLKAREFAVLCEDASYLSRINNGIGGLYLEQELPEAAIPYLQETEAYLLAQNDSSNIRLLKRNLGRAYSLLHHPDSTIIYYKEALLYASVLQRPALLNELVPLLIENNNFDLAYTYLQEIRQLSKPPLPEQVNLSFGLYFSKTHQQDSAHFYLMKCINATNILTRAAAIHYLYQMARDRKEWEEYAFYQKKYEILRDSIKENIPTKELLRLKRLYDYEKIKNEVIQAKLAHAEEKQKQILFISIAIASILLLCFITYRMRLHIKKWKEQVFHWKQMQQSQEDKYTAQINLNNTEIKKLRAELKAQNKQEQKLQKKIKQLEQKNKEIKQKSNKNNLYIKELFSSAVYKLFKDPKTRVITDEEKKEFIIRMDKAYSTFEIELKKRCPELLDDELFLCYLSKAGISLSATAIITKESETTLSNKRARLARKIFNKKESAPIFDKEIRKIN